MCCHLHTKKSPIVQTQEKKKQLNREVRPPPPPPPTLTKFLLVGMKNHVHLVRYKVILATEQFNFEEPTCIISILKSVIFEFQIEFYYSERGASWFQSSISTGAGSASRVDHSSSIPRTFLCLERLHRSQNTQIHTKIPNNLHSFRSVCLF